MELNVFELNGEKVAEVVSAEVVVQTARDALDLMATAQYEGADCLILCERHLHAAFFDLKTGLAGEILQKYANYRMKLVIIGEFAFESESLKAFMLESNRGRQVAFVPDRQTALAKIASAS